MRFLFSVLGLLCAAWLPIWSPTLHAQSPAHAPILPAAPAEVAAFLPAAPPEWKLTQSRASNQFMDWLTTEAFREYTHPPLPADRRPDGSAAPALVTRIRIIDTGYWPASSADFAVDAAGKGSTGATTTVAGYPAIRAELGKNRERLRILVKRRFVVQIDVFNQPADSVLTWAKLVDLQKLTQLPDTGSDKLPKPITLTVIDELDPRKNSVNRLQWASDAEMEAAARQTPPASR